MFTQAHLWLTARKLVKKSDQSWTKVDETISETLDELKDTLFDEQFAIRSWNWVMSAQIPTGKETENEDGTVIKETTTPISILMSSISTAIYKKFMSGKGGMMKGVNSLAEGLSAEGAPFMQLGPQKGESPTVFALKQMLMPIIEQKVKELAKQSVNLGGAAETW